MTEYSSSSLELASHGNASAACADLRGDCTTSVQHDERNTPCVATIRKLDLTKMDLKSAALPTGDTQLVVYVMPQIEGNNKI